MLRIACAIAGALLAGAVQAQTVSLGGAELRLGTDKSSVLSALSAHFEIVPGLDGYALFRGREGERLGEPAGMVRFADGRLAHIQRSIGSFHGEDATRTLRRTIAAFADAPAGDDPQVVRTETGRSGRASTSRVIFDLPDRQIVIDVYEPDDPGAPVSAEVTEHFSLAAP